VARTFGTGKDLSLGNATPLELTGDITAAGWLKTTDAGQQHVLGCYLAISPFTGWAVGVNAGSGQIGKFQYWSDGNGAWQTSTSTVNDGTYRHCGVTVAGTGAGAGTFWRDGSTDGTFSQTAPGASGATKRIGAKADGTANFVGDLAEWAVWLAALDAAEMAALAKGVSPLLIRPAALVAYWPIHGSASPEPDWWRNGLGGTLTGTPAQADHTRIVYPAGRTWPSPSAASTAYSLAAAAGSYALTGSAAALKAARLLAAAAGAYTLTGSAATVRVARLLSAAAGAYVVTGQAAGLYKGRTLTAGAGSYGLSGSAAALKAARKIVATAGTYALTGSDATLIYTIVSTSGRVYILPATGRTFVLPDSDRSFP
jgi:hypothetical protein